MQVAELSRSDRITARGPRFARRSRVSIGPLRIARTRWGAGAAKGMMTGGLLGLATLAAFTLPFARSGAGPETREAELAQRPAMTATRIDPAPARVAAAPMPAEAAPIPTRVEPQRAAAAEPQRAAAAGWQLDQIATPDDPTPEIEAPPPAPRTRGLAPAQRRAETRCKDTPSAPCPIRARP